MVDNAPVSAPSAPSSSTPSPAPASAPSASSVPASSGYQDPYADTSPDAIFGDLRKQLGLDTDDSVQIDDPHTMVHEGSEEDLFGLGAEEEATESPTTTEENQLTEDTSAAETVEEPAYEVDYAYEGKVGNEEVKLHIKSREQMDNIIARAVHYGKLADSYKTLRKEIEPLREHSKQLEFMDQQLREKPLEFINNVIEDMPDEQVREWLLQVATEYGKSAQEREVSKKLRQAELTQRQMEMIQKQQEQLERQRIQAAREADKHTVRAWADGILTRSKARIPEQFHDIVNQQLKFALMEGKEQRNKGQDVSVQTLNSIFQRNMAPYMKLISGSAKDNAKAVEKEVGKAVQQKREQSLQRVQSIASKAQPTNQQKTRMQVAAEESDVGGMFDEIIRGVKSGRIRITE